MLVAHLKCLLSTNDRLCQISANRNPQFGVKKEIFFVHSNSTVIQHSCEAALRPGPSPAREALLCSGESSGFQLSREMQSSIFHGKGKCTPVYSFNNNDPSTLNCELLEGKDSVSLIPISRVLMQYLNKCLVDEGLNKNPLEIQANFGMPSGIAAQHSQ